MHIHTVIVSFVLVVWMTGCGITQPLRPVEEGTTELIASLGGPVIPVGGIAFPVPYLNFGGVYGYKPNLSLFANAHVTALLFKDIGIDAGFSTRIIKEKGIRPEITFNGRAYFFWDVFRGSTTRLYPMGTVTASYRAGEKSLIYFGADDLFQFVPSEMFFSPFVGYSFPIGVALQLQVESKWMAMNQATSHGIFEGMASIGGKGNVGLFFGLQYHLE